MAKNDQATKETKEEPDTLKLNLFVASGIRNKEYWQCIRYISPNDSKKRWKAGDSTGVYCLECKAKVKYDSTKNTKGVQRHMEKCHPKMLEAYREKESSTNKRKSSAGIGAFFAKKIKSDQKKASAPNQSKFIGNFVTDSLDWTQQ